MIGIVFGEPFFKSVHDFNPLVVVAVGILRILVITAGRTRIGVNIGSSSDFPATHARNLVSEIVTTKPFVIENGLWGALDKLAKGETRTGG